MGKVEERALKAYPIQMSQYSDNCKEYDSNESDRLTFIEGYHQAEKDLELTWKDLATIEKLGDDLSSTTTRFMSDEEFYKEVLKRFSKQKKENKA